MAHRDSKPSDYIRLAFKIGVKSISLAEGKEITEYFTRVLQHQDAHQARGAEARMIDKVMRTQTLLNKNELKMKSQMRGAGGHHQIAGDQNK